MLVWHLDFFFLSLLSFHSIETPRKHWQNELFSGAASLHICGNIVKMRGEKNCRELRQQEKKYT